MNQNKHTEMITIRLLRKDYNEPSMDDVLYIKHKGENIYHVYYRDAWNTFKDNHMHMTVLDGDELDTYLYSFFTLISGDSEPFDGIQFQIPCFPSVMYSAKDLKKPEIQQSLMDLMPLLTTASCVPAIRERR